MSSRTERMYDKKKQPHLERDEEGKMGVKKGEQKADEVEAGVDGEMREGDEMPHHMRHAMERGDMSRRHETEHMMHDHAHDGEGDKKIMHARHEKERREMHTRHEKEVTEKDGPMSGKTGADQIKKVEADDKD